METISPGIKVNEVAPRGHMMAALHFMGRKPGGRHRRAIGKPATKGMAMPACTYCVRHHVLKEIVKAFRQRVQEYKVLDYGVGAFQEMTGIEICPQAAPAASPAV